MLLRRCAPRCHIRPAFVLLAVIVGLAVLLSTNHPLADPLRSTAAPHPSPEASATVSERRTAPTDSSTQHLDELRRRVLPATASTAGRRPRLLFFSNRSLQRRTPSPSPRSIEGTPIAATTVTSVAQRLSRSARLAAFQRTRRNASSSIRPAGERPSAADDDVGRRSQWTPGGVVGPTLLEVERDLAALFETLSRQHTESTNSSGEGRARIVPSVVAVDHAGDGSNDDAAATETDLCLAARGGGIANTRQGDGGALRVWQFLSDATSALVAQSLRQEDDCRMHLPPHQRAMCFLLAAMDATDCSDRPNTWPKTAVNRTNHNTWASVPLTDRCAYRESYCGHLTPCVQWSRGVFSPPLSPHRLRHVYQARVLPRLVAAAGAFKAHQELFLHGEVAHVPLSPPAYDGVPAASAGSTSMRSGGSTAIAQAEQLYGGRALTRNMREMGWLRRRLRVQEAHLEKTQTIFTALLQHPPSARRAPGAYAAASQTATPTCAIFQGHNVSTELLHRAPTTGDHSEPAGRRFADESAHQEYTISVSRPSAGAASGSTSTQRFLEGEGTTTLTYLDAEETLSALLHLCEHDAAANDNESNRGSSVPPQPACVLLFHGDSLARETFTRLILHLRYGATGVPLRDSLYPPTHIEVGIFNDIVYRLFPTHDEILLLENNATIGKVALSFKAPQSPQSTTAGSVVGGNGTTTDPSSAPPSDGGGLNGSTINRAWTLSTYLNDLAQFSKMNRQARARQGAAAPQRLSLQQPLVHIIFCWDHRSNVPRAVGYGERSRRDAPLPPPQHARHTLNRTNAAIDTPPGGKRKRRYWEEVDDAEDEDGDWDDTAAQRSESQQPASSADGGGYNLADDVSLATYEAAGDVVIPVQLQGVTFWQRLLHRRLLRRMTHHATLGQRRRRAAAADGDAPQQRPAAAVVPRRRQSPPTALRDMYVMTPLNHDSLQPLLTAFVPPLAHNDAVASVCQQQQQYDDATAADGSRAPAMDGGVCSLCDPAWGRNGAVHVRIRAEETCLKRPPPSNTSHTFLATTENSNEGPTRRQRLLVPGRGRGGGEPRSRCETPNIAKTLQLFEWLNKTMAKRALDSHRPDDAVSHDPGATTTGPPQPRRLLWGSVALFDKSKGQFAGLPMGDHRHFSCHARTSLRCEQRGFYQSLSRESIQSLLSPLFMATARRRSYRHDHTSSRASSFSARSDAPTGSPFDGGPIGTAPSLPAGYGTMTLCRNTVSVQHLTGLIGVAVRGKGPILWRMQGAHAIQPIGVVAAGAVRLPSQPLLPNQSPFYRRLVRRRHTAGAVGQDALAYFVVAQPSPPKNLVSIIGNGNNRCRNSGDLYLLQLMLHDALWKRVNATATRRRGRIDG